MVEQEYTIKDKSQCIRQSFLIKQCRCGPDITLLIGMKVKLESDRKGLHLYIKEDIKALTATNLSCIAISYKFGGDYFCKMC